MLMFDGRHTTANFFTLNIFDIGQHFIVAKIPIGQVIHDFGRAVECRQGNQIMENPRLSCDIGLEISQSCISFEPQCIFIKVF